MEWAQFRVANEGQYGGGSELEHHRERCNWSAAIDDLNPLEISELAIAHATACTGLPIPPKPSAPPTAMGSLIADVWAEQIHAVLRRAPLQAGFSVPGTGTDDA